MKNKLLVCWLITIGIILCMLLEYIYIIHNIRPYIGDENIVYIELFGQVHGYYASPL